MVVLKIPIVCICGVIYRAIKSDAAEASPRVRVRVPRVDPRPGFGRPARARTRVRGARTEARRAGPSPPTPVRLACHVRPHR